jgi:hypothetical protein
MADLCHVISMSRKARDENTNIRRIIALRQSDYIFIIFKLFYCQIHTQCTGDV